MKWFVVALGILSVAMLARARHRRALRRFWRE